MTALTASPVTVNFHGAAIPTFSVEGVIRVAMKPICDAIGLQWEAQLKRIKRHPVLSATMSMMDTVARDGKRRKLLTLPLNKLNGWLFGIDTNRVKPEIREKLVAYQAECFDVLADYWQKGEATNPRTTVSERRPLNRAVRTLANLRSAQGESADYGGMWKLVNGYLGVASIEDASQEQVDRAMVFVQDSIERETRNIIEGEYLARQTLPAAGTDTIHYPLTRRFEEWQPHHMVGEDAMYHSDIRRLVQQLLDAARSGEPLMVSNIDNVREELQALTHLCEMRDIQQRAAESRLTDVESFVASLAKTTGRLQSALTR